VDRLPLDGVRVLDMTVAWSGPYVTMLLADFGAEVIRVENPWVFPTSTRGVFPRPSKETVAAAGNLNMAGYPDLDPGDRPWNRSAIFNWHSRNKRSVTLDLRQESGRELFLRLVDVSHVLVENNAVTTLGRLGIDEATLLARNDRFIVMRMPSMGLDGPHSGFIGMGGSFEAIAGLKAFRGFPGTPPDLVPSSLHMDAASGTTGAFAAMMGLRRLRREGVGGLVELPQLENLIHHFGEVVVAGSRGVEAEPMGNRDAWHAPQGVYPCSGTDRWVAVSVGSDEEWLAFRRAMGDPDWSRDLRFETVAGRLDGLDELDARISDWTRDLDRYEVFHRCQAEGVAAAPVADEADLHADPQLQHRGFFRPLSSPHTGDHIYPTHGVTWTGPPLRWDRHPPGLGEDNEYVYKQILQLSDDEYEEVSAQGHLSIDYLDRDGRRL
jgi:crotonobetainyl-CoA:carnitine CoA-transferase CaiB-like acyl-CoA transferase